MRQIRRLALLSASLARQRDVTVGVVTRPQANIAVLDVQVITAPSLRLDLEADRARLEETVAMLKPRLLILDPFVRAAPASHRRECQWGRGPLLAFLRELQQRYAVAVAVVHRARKGAGTVRTGQALRGSSEFHAWGDSNLYLRRDNDDRVVLTAEHRAAPDTQRHPRTRPRR